MLVLIYKNNLDHLLTNIYLSNQKTHYQSYESETECSGKAFFGSFWGECQKELPPKGCPPFGGSSLYHATCSASSAAVSSLSTEIFSFPAIILTIFIASASTFKMNLGSSRIAFIQLFR